MIPALAKFNFQHAIPIPFLVAGFILASLCLSAGNKPGFMEEYALVRIDMSGLGNNLFTSSNDTSSDEDDKEDEDKDDEEDKEDDDDSGGISDLIPRRHRRDITDIGDDIGDTVDEAKDKAKDKIGELGNELVDGLTEELGVKDWYSLHILTFCQGEFKNGTNNDTEVNKNGFEVDECSKPSANGKFNLTEVLGTDSLSAGPIDIPIPSGIQRQLQKLYGIVHGLIVLYGLTIGCAVVAFISNIITIIRPRTYPYRFMRFNFILSFIAAFSAMIGSIATTIATITISEALRDIGELIGVRVVKGWQFLAITWSMFGVVFVAAAYWGVVYWRERRFRRGEGTDEFKSAKQTMNQVRSTSAKDHKRGQYEMTGGQFMEKARSVMRG